MFGAPARHRVRTAGPWPASARARPGSTWGHRPGRGRRLPDRPGCRPAGAPGGRACSCWPTHGSASLPRPGSSSPTATWTPVCSSRWPRWPPPNRCGILAFADAGPGSGWAHRCGPPSSSPPATNRAGHAGLPPGSAAALPAGSSGLSRGPAGQWTLTIQFTAPSPLGLLGRPGLATCPRRHGREVSTLSWAYRGGILRSHGPAREFTPRCGDSRNHGFELSAYRRVPTPAHFLQRRRELPGRPNGRGNAQPTHAHSGIVPAVDRRPDRKRRARRDDLR